MVKPADRNKPVLPPAAEGGQLWLGDCLDVVRTLTPGSFRLIYLDPPFLTGREQVGTDDRFRYDDTWPERLAGYLPWLRERVAAMIPLLCANGSLVLHLDWHVAHHGRLMLDELLGPSKFQNEIIWHYTGGGRSRLRFSRKHDSLLWYRRGGRPLFNIDAVRVPYQQTSGFARSGIVSKAGRRYLPHPAGTPVDDVWNIPIINPLSPERVGYPTQKPLALLNRLVTALSAPGEQIGDFFCGSGTTLVAAQQAGRAWVGSDRSPTAISCAHDRLKAIGAAKVAMLSQDAG